jgi:hypothetical protein
MKKVCETCNNIKYQYGATRDAKIIDKCSKDIWKMKYTLNCDCEFYLDITKMTCEAWEMPT